MIMAITISIAKADVMAEVKKTSEYIGAKSQQGDYDRVALIDANEEQLERWWKECCATVSGALERWLTSANYTVDCNLMLSPSAAWPDVLQSAVAILLKSYFVNTILAQWLLIVQPDSAATYAKLAEGALTDAVGKMYYKKPPTHE